MAKIECTNDQLKLIQQALDFYSRIGIGQFNAIKDHPTFEKSVYTQSAPKKELEVGDKTMRGEIVKITKKYIETKGCWGGQEEIKRWADIENIKHSPDWEKYHGIREDADDTLVIARNLLCGISVGKNGSWGIYNPQVDESCREAFSIIEKIRHQFWLANPNRSNMTVDSTDGNSNVKVEID